MNKITFCFISCILAAGLLAGCASPKAPASSATTQKSAASIAASQPAASAATGISDGKEGANALALVPQWAYNFSEENPSKDPAKDNDVPSFLTPNQQDVFRAAKRMYDGIGGGCTPGYDKDYETSYQVPYNGFEITYTLDRAFDSYDAFLKALHAVFTDAYCEQLLVTEEAASVQEHEGKLYALDADRGSNIEYVGTNYELLSQTDSEIRFAMTGHYNPTAYNDTKLDPKQERTEAHEVSMQLTDAGWRMASMATLR